MGKMKIKTYSVIMQKSLYILPNIWVTWNDSYVGISFGWLKWTFDIDLYKNG